MKRKLPNNSLREKMDSTSYEFEEAHWENLAAMLHEEGGLGVEKRGRNKSKFFLGFGALLLGSVLVGMFYFLQKENTVLLVDAPQEKTTEFEKSISSLKSKEDANISLEKSEKVEKTEQNTVKRENQNIEIFNTNSKDIPRKKPLLNSKNNTKTKSVIDKNQSPIALNNSILLDQEEGVEKVIEKNNFEKISSTKLVDEKKVFSESEESISALVEIAENKLGKLGTTELLESFITPVDVPSAPLLDLDPIGLQPFRKARRKLRIGFLTGFNFSNGKPGLTFGLSLERRLNPQWYIELDMSYRGSHIDAWEIDPVNLVNHNESNFAKSVNLLRYTDFPLMVKWRPRQRFTFYAGPKLAFLSLANGEIHTEVTIEQNPVNPPIIEQRIRQGVIYPLTIRGMRTIEWGAVFGATVHLDKNIGLGLRGHLGLTPFVDRLSINPSPQNRNLDLQFLVQLYF